MTISTLAGWITLWGSLLALFCACDRACADATESAGISAFRADVTVKSDATLDVREEITLDSGGKFYRHGFIRNLPIGSEDRWDSRYVGEYKRDNGIRVKILEVTKDGNPVAYEQGRGYGYSQLRIGENNAPLPPGEHRYVIRYTVDGALNLGATRDTFYWNAIGHEGNEPVAEAILSVHLPPQVFACNAIAEPRIVPTQPRRQIEGFAAVRRVEQTAPYTLRRNDRHRERTEQKKKGCQQVKPAALPQFDRSVLPKTPHRLISGSDLCRAAIYPNLQA